MSIQSLLREELTCANIDGVSKKRVIDTIAQLFASSEEQIDAAALFMQFISREKLGSTGIGHGIAIPHCRYADTDKTLVACISLSEGIDFDSVDNEPVDIVFAMVVPEDANDEHLTILSSLAEMMQKPDYVKALRRAKTSEALFKAATAK